MTNQGPERNAQGDGGGGWRGVILTLQIRMNINNHHRKNTANQITQRQMRIPSGYYLYTEDSFTITLLLFLPRLNQKVRAKTNKESTMERSIQEKIASDFAVPST